jgi:hypothetical protein
MVERCTSRHIIGMELVECHESRGLTCIPENIMIAADTTGLCFDANVVGVEDVAQADKASGSLGQDQRGLTERRGSILKCEKPCEMEDLRKSMYSRA